MPDVSPPHSVVITGVGLACGLGLDAETAWQRVLAGRRGIGPMDAMEQPLPPGSDGGQALDLPGDFEPDLPREARYLRWAITRALADAGDTPYAPARRAVMLGTTLHGMRAGGRFMRSGDPADLADFLAGDVVARATAGLALHGGAATTCSACSSSLGSIALGVTLLQRGEADLVVAGGYDPVSEYAWAGFNALRLVSGPPLRPFARGRCGMKLAEAYAIVVLERAADADRRGARAIAVVAGWGESADAHHLTQPHPRGQGAADAMRQAIAAARLTPADIGLIAAHATGTRDNDAAEFAAMRDVFASGLLDVPVVAFKSHLGHTLGGAGAIELIFSAMALRDQVAPPTAMDDGETVEFNGLRLTRGLPVPAALRATLNTSLGFGGANTSVVLTPVPTTHAPSVAATSALPLAAAGHAVVVTGIGVILPGIYDRAAFRARRGTTADDTLDIGRVESLLNARRVRRMSDYVKLTLAAATLAGRDAFGDRGVPPDTAAILGTTHGSAGFSQTYYRQLVTDGVTAANPLLFAEGVPNAAAAQLSLMLGLVGPCQTIVGTHTAGLDALRLAMLRLAAGDWARCVVSAGEEDSPVVAAAYQACGARADDTSGAVALILERADVAAARGATVLATLTHAAAASGARDATVDTLARALRPLPRADRIVHSDRPGAAAARRAERGEPQTPLPTRLAGRFSVTPLAALAAAIDDGGSFVVGASDPGGTAAAMRGQGASR